MGNRLKRYTLQARWARSTRFLACGVGMIASDAVRRADDVTRVPKPCVLGEEQRRSTGRTRAPMTSSTTNKWTHKVSGKELLSASWDKAGSSTG